MREGWYSDKYFINIARTLAELAARGYRFGGTAPDLSDLDVDLRNVDVGNIEVEMQWFPRRQPSTVVVGVDKALAMLRECTGYFEDGRFVNTFDRMEVWAVHDGSEAPYDGDVLHVTPVMRVRAATATSRSWRLRPWARSPAAAGSPPTCTRCSRPRAGSRSCSSRPLRRARGAGRGRLRVPGRGQPLQPELRQEHRRLRVHGRAG
jgi:hypothetical protein